MDIERTDNFFPVRNLTEEVERIAIMKAALRAFTDDHERSLIAVQKRLKAGKHQIDVCTQEFNSLELKINALESKIAESILSNKAAETGATKTQRAYYQKTEKNCQSSYKALNTVRENRCIKRKIIALKHDMEQQEKLLNRANETMNAVHKNCVKNKKLKELPTLST